MGYLIPGITDIVYPAQPTLFIPRDFNDVEKLMRISYERHEIFDDTVYFAIGLVARTMADIRIRIAPDDALYVAQGAYAVGNEALSYELYARFPETLSGLADELAQLDEVTWNCIPRRMFVRQRAYEFVSVHMLLKSTVDHRDDISPWNANIDDFNKFFDNMSIASE